METGETVEKEEISEKNDTIEETSKPRYIKEHTFYTQTEALLSSNSKIELQDLYKKYVRNAYTIYRTLKSLYPQICSTEGVHHSRQWHRDLLRQKLSSR